MNSPAPIPPPAPRVAARVGAVLLRVVFACVPVVTVGILAWVPLLYLAIAGRRVRDWIWCGVVTAGSVTGFVLVGSSDNDDDVQTNVGMSVLLALIAFATAYFLVVDVRRQEARRTSGFERVPPPGPAARVPGRPPVPEGPHSPPPQQPWVATGHSPEYRAGDPSPRPQTARMGQVRAELDELSAYLREQAQEQGQEPTPWQRRDQSLGGR